MSCVLVCVLQGCCALFAFLWRRIGGALVGFPGTFGRGARSSHSHSPLALQPGFTRGCNWCVLVMIPECSSGANRMMGMRGRSADDVRPALGALVPGVCSSWAATTCRCTASLPCLSEASGCGYLGVALALVLVRALAAASSLEPLLRLACEIDPHWAFECTSSCSAPLAHGSN